MPGTKSEAERDGADGAEKKFVSREEVCTVKMMRDQAQQVYSKVDLSTGKPYHAVGTLAVKMSGAKSTVGSFFGYVHIASSCPKRPYEGGTMTHPSGQGEGQSRQRAGPNALGRCHLAM
jgi:hypothetical protein